MLTKAVTDTSSSPNTTRTWSWTYNAQQLVATSTEPNGAVTTYEYDTRGNLTKSANALGHVTQYDYDNANRVISETAPNGLVTAYTYDQRNRVLTRTVGGQQTTTLTYKPFGTVEAITLPTGLVLTYTYDAAHRLTGWSNNRGEQGIFTLDAMGNRTAEQVKDSSGAIAWMFARNVNSINRLYSSTEGSNQTNTFGYDANGERTSETNGLNESTAYGLDNLRRVKSITNPANATATLAWNSLDAVTQAKDFKGVATNYSRDAQGNATAETSADIGSRGMQYDGLGLPIQIVDALGQATQIQRDALGRPTALTFADGKSSVLRYDLSGSTYNASGAPNASIGYLSEMQDRSGVTRYVRDSFGRVIQVSQSFPNGLNGAILYTYTSAGLRSSMTNPGGFVTDYHYDATGRLSQIDFRGVPQITNITWNPMGQPTSWTWAFGNNFLGDVGTDIATARTYDTAGRLTGISTGGQSVLQYTYDAAGRPQSMTQWLAKPDNPSDPYSSVSASLVTWTPGYDAAGRLTTFNAPNNTASFAYDANGNRASSSQTVDGLTVSRTYTVQDNRILGFTQTSAASSTSVAYGYNANGDLVSDGLRSLYYDAEGRLSSVTVGATDSSPTTRYAHNALGQRVFKSEPLYPPAQGDENDPSFMQSLISFFSSLLWTPPIQGTEYLGYAYAYDLDGTLLGELGMGGANSSSQAFYIWLPTASGPIPVMMNTATARYAVTSDHLNTPRFLANIDGALQWQWEYSAFGDVQPTIASRRFAKVAPNPGDLEFNLRYPGQSADKESGLFYNYFRSYSPMMGRYSQPDPIGLRGGFNRFNYVDANPIGSVDADGLQPQTRPLRPIENQLLEGGGAAGGGGGAGPWTPFGGVNGATSGGRKIADGVGSPADRFLQITQPGPMTVGQTRGGDLRISGTPNGGGGQGRTNLRFPSDSGPRVDLHGNGCRITEHWD